MGKRGSLALIVLCAVLTAAVAGRAGEFFSDAMLGYSIEVPSGWAVTRPDEYSVRFGGPLGAYFKIQNVASAAYGGNHENIASLVANLKCQLASATDTLSLHGAGVFNVTDADGAPLEGWQFLADYLYAGINVREWYGVVARVRGDVFYVLSYTASADVYAVYEPAVIASLRTWVVGGAAGADTTPSPGASSGIVVLLEDRGHIGPYHYETSSYDKRVYEFTVSASGFVSLCVVDEAGEAITGWIFAADGTQVTVKPGNFADVYTSSTPIGPGTYTVKIGQDNIVTESDFVMQVYFSLTPFTIDDLVAGFGPRVRVLP